MTLTVIECLLACLLLSYMCNEVPVVDKQGQKEGGLGQPKCPDRLLRGRIGGDLHHHGVFPGRRPVIAARSNAVRRAEGTRQTTAARNWKNGLPVLAGSGFTLRELRIDDAHLLFAMLTTEKVARFISAPPTTIEGFERFIQWTLFERQAGNCVCFAIVPKGMTTAIGLFQVRSLEPGFATAEWGFVMGSPFWGSGIFAEGAPLVLDFAFDVIGAHRLEARAAVANIRGNAALHKLGAVREGVLRRSFHRHGHRHDQVLWGILADDWRIQRMGQLTATTLAH
jgi:RimJ/RimL family protein N-acetyltransferase